MRGVGIAFAASLVIAYLGALGTGEAPFGQRLLYWSAVILPGSIFGLAAQALVRGWGLFAGRRWAEVMMVALLMSLPHSFLVIVASALFFGVAAITPALVLNFWSAVFVISAVLTAINHLANAEDEAAQAAAPLGARSPGEPSPAPAAPSAPAGQPAEPAADAAPVLPPIPALLAEKLPPGLRAGRLIAIEAEDHYLRIHTDLGSDLVLMRMIDACALLGEPLGARVHRSWWVARAAVQARVRREGRTELVLPGGLAAPVSRTMRATIDTPEWAGART